MLSACRHVYVPKTQAAAESIALDIARSYLRPDAVTHELTFPMTADEHLLRESWREAAREVHRTLAAGDDCCFLTLGDPFLYSTYVYLSRELRAIDAGAKIVTIPGITAMSAAAAVAGFPIGQQKRLVTIVPGSDDMGQFTASLDRGGTVVLMKIGRGLETVLAELESRGLLDRAVFVSHAGMPQQVVETDLRRLRGMPEHTGYLSILLVDASPSKGEAQGRSIFRRQGVVGEETAGRKHGPVPFPPAEERTP